MEDIGEILGDIPVVIARELTKMHEEFLRGTPVELLRHFQQMQPKGEMVVLFNARNSRAPEKENVKTKSQRSRDPAAKEKN